ISNLVRLKSTIRYRRFAPPPLRRIVIRPVLFRPPCLLKPSVRVLTGRPFQSSERSISTSPRWPGVVGLYDLSAMLVSSVCFAGARARLLKYRAPKVPGGQVALSKPPFVKKSAPDESGANRMGSGIRAPWKRQSCYPLQG